MSDIPPVNYSSPSPELDSTTPVDNNENVTNKKIEITEDNSVGTTQSHAETMSSDPERDEKIIEAFKNAPVDGVPTTAPVTQTSSTDGSTDATSTASTTSTESTTTAPPPSGSSASTDGETEEEQEEDFETSSAALDKIYHTSYVQSDPELKASMETDTGEWERNLSEAGHAKKSKENSQDQIKENNDEALEAYKTPGAGEDTQSSKYSE
jgi:hypothetical protein